MARASAYAELIKRLSNSILVSVIKNTKDNRYKYFVYEKEVELENYLDDDKIYLVPYIDIANEKNKEYLSISYIRNLLISHGMGTGNTIEEAFVQATGELI